MYSLLKSHNPTICNVCSDKSCDSKCKKPRQPTAKSIPKEETIPKNEIKAPSGSSLNVLASNLSSLKQEFERLKGYLKF